MALTLGKLGGYAVYMDGPDAVGQHVKVGGKTVCFDFDHRFGPLVVDHRGEPTKRQPISDDAAFWKPFEVWLAGYWKARASGQLEAYLKANDGTVPVKPLRYPGRSHPRQEVTAPADGAPMRQALSAQDDQK